LSLKLEDALTPHCQVGALNGSLCGQRNWWDAALELISVAASFAAVYVCGMGVTVI